MLVTFTTRLLIAGAIAVASFPNTATAGVFKCKDKNGDVMYSSEPCEKQGAKQQKELSKAELQSNQMRMRPRPDQGNGPADFSQGQNSNYQGAAPDKKRQQPPAGAPDPRGPQS